ncbi:MAG: hypothetical protein ABIU84_11730, partial [Thermoanaerobaculia bacterium]
NGKEEFSLMKISAMFCAAALALGCLATRTEISSRPAAVAESSIRGFLAAWLIDADHKEAASWVSKEFSLLGSTAPGLRADSPSAGDLGILLGLSEDCRGSESSQRHLSDIVRPMTNSGQKLEFDLDELLIDDGVVSAQPPLEKWRGRRLVEVDLILRHCGVGITLLFSWERRAELVAAVVAAAG